LKRLISLAAVALLVLSATAALAALTFDFETGMQGWQWYHGPDSRIPYADGEWVAPGSKPTLVGDPLIEGASGGNIFCPGDSASRATAYLDLAGICTNGKTGSFFLQADVYIPNLRPLTGFANDYPGMMNQFCGIGALPTASEWGTWIKGKPSIGSQVFVDYVGDSWTEYKQSWYMEDWTGGAYLQPDSLWWNTWITLQLDFNYSQPGQVIANYYIPWTTYNGKTGWLTLRSGAIDTATWGPTHEYNKIVLGCNVTTGETPWSKSQFDNVIFDSPDIIPEPGSLTALGAGLAAMAGAVLRRRTR